MRRFYGMGLDEARHRVTLTELADMVLYLPREGALGRSMDEHWRRSPEVDLLREIEHNVRLHMWMGSRDGEKGRNIPEPIRLPWDPKPEGGHVGDRMDWDEAADWLGWHDEMRRWFADDT